jgi:hypothetical protein
MSKVFYRVHSCDEEAYQAINRPHPGCNIGLIQVGVVIDGGSIEEPGADVLCIEMFSGDDDALFGRYAYLYGLYAHWRDYEWIIQDSQCTVTEMRKLYLALRHRL